MKSSIQHKPGTAEAVLWARMAQEVARLKGVERVTVEHLAETGLSVLAKREEDEEEVKEVLARVLGVEVD
jgi:hypothetical protein